MLELDFRTGGECELAFFGLITELTGQGNGQWLMDNALSLAWRKGIGRVWVHTCTLDHPRALGFYRKQGFSAFETMIEIFADPRIAGIIPRDSAPHIPLIEPDIRP
jgi:GNAT superfamily N-acetyltransferase